MRDALLLILSTILLATLTMSCRTREAELHYYRAVPLEPDESEPGEWKKKSFNSVLGNSVEIWYDESSGFKLPITEGIEQSRLVVLPQPIEGAGIPAEPVEARLTVPERYSREFQMWKERGSVGLLVVLFDSHRVLGTADLTDADIIPGGVFSSFDEARSWYGEFGVEVSRLNEESDETQSDAVALGAYFDRMRWHVECDSPEAPLYLDDYRRLKALVDSANAQDPVDCSEPPSTM